MRRGPPVLKLSSRELHYEPSPLTPSQSSLFNPLPSKCQSRMEGKDRVEQGEHGYDRGVWGERSEQRHLVIGV